MGFFKQIRRLAYLAALLGYTFFELLHSGLTRRTFEFPALANGELVVEDRMLYKADSLEQNIKNYVEELILGPISITCAPLLTKGVKLQSFMYRDGTVYADFSGDAALPVQGGAPLFESFLALNRGIRRNFHSISNVKLFVNGNEVFFSEFDRIFGPNPRN
ncbi:MAG: GerMN domain-containing protein [Spirochaetaceae bacterium]|jgi:hypothetical protein|nr:GerMN domain-containing protein [Spirochaetaceae bacterium]